MQLSLDVVVDRFIKVARKELKRWYVPNSCIASTRVTIDVFRALGFKAEPLSMYYQLYDKTNEQIHICGVQYLKEELPKDTVNTARNTDDNWDGHVIAIIEDKWLIDPTWDGPLCNWNSALSPDSVFAMPLETQFSQDSNNELMALITHDSGLELEAKYVIVDDDSYTHQPAWEDDHTEIATELILRSIRRNIPVPAGDLILYVVYRDGQGYLCRRWRLGKEITPDQNVSALAPDEDALNLLRRKMLDRGLVRLNKFMVGIPAILEMWI